MSCSLVKFNPRFGKTNCLHLQGLIVSQARNQTETAGKPGRQISLYFVLTIHFPLFVLLRLQYLFSFSFLCLLLTYVELCPNREWGMKAVQSFQCLIATDFVCGDYVLTFPSRKLLPQWGRQI